jgi:hypothetical protein
MFIDITIHERLAKPIYGRHDISLLTELANIFLIAEGYKHCAATRLKRS